MRSILVVLLTSLLVAAAEGQSRNYPPTFAGAQEELYKTVGDVDLRLWVFRPDEWTAHDSRPAIVFFFGGGWKAGTPGQFEKQCRYLAEQGMVAITADYRVRQRHGTLADKCVSDAKSAIRWVRGHAKQLGVDPNRIVAAGGSAGGHLAACTGVVPGFDESSEDPSLSSVPNAMALFNPALILAPYGEFAINPQVAADIATRTGTPPQQLSPIHHVRDGLPPTIIFHGEADSTVPFDTAEKYTEVATKAGNRCELASYPDAGHGFFNYGRGGTPGEFYALTVERLHQFLHSLGYLESPTGSATTANVGESSDSEPNADVQTSVKDKGNVQSEQDQSNVHRRDDFRNALSTISESKKATVAFIGGSITEMNGYRVMVQDFLSDQFPHTDFTFINAGISSTCSTTGAFRLQRDVLSRRPDLLFVEFAVNDDQDAAHAGRECRRGMEGIVRAALTNDPNIEIVITHFVNPPMLKTLQQGGTPISSSSHEAVAKHYGVSTIDLAKEVAERISAGALTWKEYGGTHPAPAGNRIAADMVVELLTSGWNSSHVEFTVRDSAVPAVPEPLDERSYSNGVLVDVANAAADEHWSLGRPDWENIAGSKRERFLQERMLSAVASGAELTLQFDGTAVGMYVLAGPDAGIVEFSIDGAPTRKLDLYHRFSRGLHYPRTIMFDADLAPGPHELKLTVSDQSNPASTGNAIRILAFAVNESP